MIFAELWVSGRRSFREDLVQGLGLAAGGGRGDGRRFRRRAALACDLVEPLGKSQPTVSHHLKVLREAGLFTSEKRGVNVWYGVVPAALEGLRTALAPR